MYEWLVDFGAECSKCTVELLQSSSSPGFQHPVSLRVLMGAFGLMWGGVGGWLEQ